MNDTIKKKCLICDEEFSASHDQPWKFLCPTHTQEIYIPLRRNYSFQSALQLIELAILLDDIEMLYAFKEGSSTSKMEFTLC